MDFNLITILGPTAVGKTRLAAELAYKYSGEIISADSRQVYRNMDIGTGKDISDYSVEDKIIPYHLIDVLEPSEEFNLFLFNKYFYKTFAEITSRNNIPMLTGGTGLFIHSILRRYEFTEADIDENKYAELDQLSLNELTERLEKVNTRLHNTTDLLVKDRVIKAVIIAESSGSSIIGNKTSINSLVIGVRLEREKIKERITKRLQQRLNDGMIEEVEGLIKSGITFEKLYFFGLEYKFIGQYLKGELNYNDMYQKLNSAIHAFAKRQMTWFRKMEREGININWIDGADVFAASNIIEKEYFKRAI